MSKKAGKLASTNQLFSKRQEWLNFLSVLSFLLAFACRTTTTSDDDTPASASQAPLKHYYEEIYRKAKEDGKKLDLTNVQQITVFQEKSSGFSLFETESVVAYAVKMLTGHAGPSGAGKGARAEASEYAEEAGTRGDSKRPAPNHAEEVVVSHTESKTPAPSNEGQQVKEEAPKAPSAEGKAMETHELKREQFHGTWPFGDQTTIPVHYVRDPIVVEDQMVFDPGIYVISAEKDSYWPHKVAYEKMRAGKLDSMDLFYIDRWRSNPSKNHILFDREKNLIICQISLLKTPEDFLQAYFQAKRLSTDPEWSDRLGEYRVETHQQIYRENAKDLIMAAYRGLPPGLEKRHPLYGPINREVAFVLGGARPHRTYLEEAMSVGDVPAYIIYINNHGALPDWEKFKAALSSDPKHVKTFAVDLADIATKFPNVNFMPAEVPVAPPAPTLDSAPRS